MIDVKRSGASLAQVGRLLHPGYVSQTWDELPDLFGGGIAQSADTLVAKVTPVYQARAVDRCALEVTATGTATAARIAFYTNLDGWPSQLIAQTGDIDVTTTGVKEAAITAQFPAGTVWRAFLLNGTCTIRSGNTNANNPMVAQWLLGTANPSGYFASTAGNRFASVQAAATFASGAPATFPAATRLFNNGPIIPVRWA